MKEKRWQNKKAWTIYLDNWKICHEIVEKRDGRKCQIPFCDNEFLDLDHVFSRECKTLFFDTNNLGFLCKPHHTHKSCRKGQWVDMMVRDIAISRAGKEWYQNAIEISRNICGKFRTVYYQEQINEMLKKDLAWMKK